MQTEYISKRQVKVPQKAPSALSNLLKKTQEGLDQGGGLDTVRWLHDSLAFLTEFFAAFAVGALHTVGPYSQDVQKLLEQPPSLDRTERLLSQAFIDWKAHPHHPAYESLRETFFLSSRLQSSRFAPRRHTRWLGVEGRAVSGLERLTRWSRRLDLVVTGKDENAARSFVEVYTPVLWTWTDAVQDFFASWTVEVETKVADGSLSLSGSAAKSDVRLNLVPVQQISGLKCRYETDGNGGVTVAGFATATVASPSTESLDPAPTPTPSPISGAPEEELQLVFDPVTGGYVSKSVSAAVAPAEIVEPEPVPSPPLPDALEQAEVPPPDSIDALEQSAEVPPPDFIEEQAEVPPPDFIDALEQSAEVPPPDFIEEQAEVPPPDFIDALEQSAEVPPPDFIEEQAEVPPPSELQGAGEVSTSEELSLPPAVSVVPPMPTFDDPMLPDLGSSSFPDFSPPQPPEFAGPTEAVSAEPPMAPDLSAPTAEPEEAAEPEPPSVPDFSAAPEPVPPAPPEEPEQASIPDFLPPVEPEEATIPDFASPPELELASSAEASPAEPDVESPPPAEPEPPSIPDFSAAAAPEPEPVPPAPPEEPEQASIPDFLPPVEPEEATIADFASPPETELASSAEASPTEPDVESPPPAEPEPPSIPDFSAAAAPEPEPVPPAPPEEPEQASIPDFLPPVEPEEATIADFASPPELELESPSPAEPEPSSVPDFSGAAAPEPGTFQPPEEPGPEEDIVPDLASPPEPTVPVIPDFSAPAVPDFTAAETGSGIPDFSAPASAPDFSPPETPIGPQVPFFEPPDSQEIPATVEVPLVSLGVTGEEDESDAPSVEQTIEVDLTAQKPIEDAVPPSIEIETPVANREMGATAEEILEDDYQFSPEDGPARPHWNGWSVDQREAVQDVCEQLIEQEKTRKAESFIGPVMEALNGPAAKIQVVMQAGCGKSRLAHHLARLQADSPSFIPALASWDVANPDALPGEILLQFYYELRESKRRLNSQIALPEPQAVSTLAVVADQSGFSEAFQRLVGQVAAINRKPLLFIIDEPPDKVRQALALTAPPNVRFLTLVNADKAQDSLGIRVDLERKWKAASAELFGEAARSFFDHDDATLLRLSLALEMDKAGLKMDDSLSLIEEAVLELDVLDSELLAVLSLDNRSISLDDMDQWFLDPQSVQTSLKTFPSLFDLEATRLSPVIGIAHASVRKVAEERLQEERALAARKLLGWVVVQLERTAPDRYGGLQVRELVFRNFLRLYRYAKLSNDPAILEWVIRNKELQRRRVALTGHLERPGSRYELQELLTLLAELLQTLVDSGNCDDLRDELAWAQSNLALNQLKLGLLPLAESDIARALELFEILVKNEKQYEFRPALSTTYYRASRIYEASEDSQGALDFADKAVQGFVDLVEDRGRSELAPRLGLALAHRGGLHYQADNLSAAKNDLQRASRLLESAESEQSEDESYRTIVEIELELASILLKEQDFQGAIQESGKAVKLATEALEEKSLDEFQPLLATCHAVRAKAYFKLAENERAIRDIAKSISLRNLSVDEGRLEQRYHLANDLQLKAQIDQSRGAHEDAKRDLGQAVQLLEALSNEGRRDAAPRLLACIQDRARLSLATGDSATGTQELQRALALIERQGEPQPGLKLSIMDTLLSAHVQSGNSAEALNVSQALLTQYHANQQWEPYANVQLVRGRALEQKGDLKGALEAYNQAAGLLGQLLAQGQTDELLEKVSDAYMGVGGVEHKLGHPANSVPQIKRAIDVLLHLFQQRGKYAVLPQLLKAYSLFSAGNVANNRLAEAKQSLKSGFDVLAYLEAQGGQGGVPSVKGMEQEKGELHRQRSSLLLAEGDANNALSDAEEAIKNFLVTRQHNQSGQWQDEMARTWILRSQILFRLKDFSQADKSIQEAISHFEEQVREGRYEYFSDMMKAFSVRADHASRSGKIDLVLEEYNRMLSITSSAAGSGAAIDHEVEMAKILEKRALVYQQQSMLNEAYADYESVLGLLRNQLTNKGRSELASELVRVYLARGKMTTRAGHPQHAVNDLSEAVNVAKALVSQGQVSAVPDLATALHERAEVFKVLGRGNEALQDLQGCVGFRMQLVQTNQDPQLMGELGKALLLQGTLLTQAGQPAQAAPSLDQANSIFTNLVEGQGRAEYSSELAQGLIQRVNLSSDKSDPALREVLIKAVNLVNQQAREGKPIGKDFAIECLKTVVELLQREDFDTVGSLIDSVLGLVETVVTDARAEQDFVKLTDLLLAASAGLIDDRRTARRPHFLSLACVSCNREIQMFGKNSLPRLVYCLYELGQALERSKPPNVLNYVGSSFALLGELAGQQQANEDFMRELKMMVSTWRSLPPQIPALANVSRHMLSQLLRLT